MTKIGALLFISFTFTACGESTAPLAETVEIKCSIEKFELQTDSSGRCSFQFLECSDSRKHELLCMESGSAAGVNDEELFCECSENQATYGATRLQGFDCSDPVPSETVESAFRACGRNISL